MLDKTETLISTLSADAAEARIGQLAALLHACVHAGASINFVMPYSEDDAETFWRRKVLPAMRDGTRVVWIAERDGRIVGSVQLSTDTPPNQLHRAEVTKLLVHPDFRRRGIARSLMEKLEGLAERLGRSLITLDTRTGDSAEPLYASMGYITAGKIPGYCRDTFVDRLDATTIMYKAL
jgi:ribosomal protein S18 acetylase RimI-like enzyme